MQTHPCVRNQLGAVTLDTLPVDDRCLAAKIVAIPIFVHKSEKGTAGYDTANYTPTFHAEYGRSPRVDCPS